MRGRASVARLAMVGLETVGTLLAGTSAKTITATQSRAVHADF